MTTTTTALVVACEHMDVVSASRVASTCKALQKEAKPWIEARLLAKRVIVAFLKELQPHLVSEYQMATTVIMSVDGYWKSCQRVRYPEERKRVMRVLDDKNGASRLRITWSLDTSEFELFFLLPWRPSWTILVQPLSETAGTIWTDDSSYNKGLWQEILRMGVVTR